MTIQRSPHSASQISIKQRLLSGGAWAFGGKLITAITSMALSALLARLLNTTDMGAYFLILSITTAAAMFIQLGLTQTTVKLIAESLGTGQSGRTRGALLKIFTLACLGATLITSLMTMEPGKWLIENTFNSQIITASLALAATWAIIIAFQNITAEAFRGFHAILPATLFGGLITSVASVLFFSALWLSGRQATVQQAVILSITAGAVSLLAALFVLRKKVHALPTDQSASPKTGEILAIAWPILITDVLLFALSQSTLWVLGAYRPQSEVALYGAAMRLIILVSIPLLIINAVVPPIIAEMNAQGKKSQLEHALRMTATVAGLPAFAVSICFILWGGPILELIFGEFYRSGATALALLSVGQLVNVWSGSCGLTLMMAGQQITMMVITIICGLLTIGGSLWIVQDYGTTGIAAIAAATLILQNVLMLLYAKKKVGVWTHAKFALPSMRQILSR